MKKIISLCAVIFILQTCFAQQEHQTTYNLFSFTPQKKSPAASLAKATPGNFMNHPDYGVLPHNAPCDDCIELLDKQAEAWIPVTMLHQCCALCISA